MSQKSLGLLLRQANPKVHAWRVTGSAEHWAPPPENPDGLPRPPKAEERL
jgi:hypothetical protein